MRSDLPSLRSLFLRFSFAAVVILWIGHAAESRIVELGLPAARTVIDWLSDDFAIQSMDAGSRGTNRTLRVRAVLSRPVLVKGHWLQPLRSSSGVVAGIQADMNLRSVLAHGLLLLIVVAAWPARSAFEYGFRLLLSLPFAALLTLLVVSSTVLAEFWFLPHDRFDPDGFWPLLAWSRFLMAGGGFVLAMLSSAAITWLARFASERTSVRLSAAAIAT
jgi:hypothetical protein